MREVSREKYLQNAVSFNILVHDMINLLCYECRTSKQKYFYVYKVISLYNDCEQLMMSLVRNIDILLVFRVLLLSFGHNKNLKNFVKQVKTVILRT